MWPWNFDLFMRTFSLVMAFFLKMCVIKLHKSLVKRLRHAQTTDYDWHDWLLL